MNEKILELYRQAQVPHTAIDPSNNMPYETTTFSAEKFAELIVRECCDICDEVQRQYGQYTFTATKVKDEIKERFGVEE